MRPEQYQSASSFAEALNRLAEENKQLNLERERRCGAQTPAPPRVALSDEEDAAIARVGAAVQMASLAASDAAEILPGALEDAGPRPPAEQWQLWEARREVKAARRRQLEESATGYGAQLRRGLESRS